ncbi:MAG: tRNA 4-thiouridine(8) synthase ThiI [Kiritimatiellae bacterium]|nr:tRNA 4-thiouridine(8) synthase ThiI [Kiritimatiellia bacterium]MDD5520924.1 tRNA 4-thiouridine(8) synthase ThiI [Kiritimatiellia bacterium]
MTEPKNNIKAMGLFSGGLDSQLAVCVLKDQGIDVEGITFESPFFSSANARKAADNLEIHLHVIDFTQEIMGLLVNPRHGFGQEMNPCIDCHALMIRKAGGIMIEMGFHFLSTGEVLNQRPMSQNRQSLDVVTEESGCAGFLVRPLSAKLLTETEPEKRGWVDRSRLLAIEGRNRKAQFKLAKHYGLKDIPQPAGGCKLTEPNFCIRLRDLQEHEGLDVRAVRLLRFGRHFRLGNEIRLIVGRDESENEVLEKNAVSGDIIIKPEIVPGPTCLLSRLADEEHVLAGAAVCARYCDLQSEVPVKVRIITPVAERLVDVAPVARAYIERIRI